MSKKHSDRAHAVLSASSADRWLNCTPSAVMSEKIPYTASSYADEGTLAHEIAETNILQETGHFTIKEFRERLAVHADDPNYYVPIHRDVQPYVDHVLELINLPDSMWQLEKKTDLTAFIPDGFGTTDAVVIAEGVLYIVDLKFGRGVRVSAVDNSQLKLYAAGVLLEFDTLYPIHTVRLSIVQPRLDAISTWDISPAELLQWAEDYVKPTAEIAAKGEGIHKTGDWCKFCRAKIMCPALRAEALQLAEQYFSKEDEAYAAEHGLEMEWEEGLLGIYRLSDRIQDFLESVKAHVYQRAVNGHKWPGLKLVEGRSNRRITDESAALALLKKNGFNLAVCTNTKIKGIGDLEGLLGDQFAAVLGRYVEKPKGKPTLVDESDRRPEISTANDFD